MVVSLGQASHKASVSILPWCIWDRQEPPLGAVLGSTTPASLSLPEVQLFWPRQVEESIFGNCFATKNWPSGHLLCPTLGKKYWQLHRMTRAPASSHPSWNFLFLNSNLLHFSMVTVKERVARILRVLQLFEISVAFTRPSDFSTATYEADWLAEPNQTYSTQNQQKLQNVTIVQVSSQFVFQNNRISISFHSSLSKFINFIFILNTIIWAIFWRRVSFFNVSRAQSGLFEETVPRPEQPKKIVKNNNIKFLNISYTKPNAEDDEMDNHGVIHSSFLIFFKRKCTVF